MSHHTHKEDLQRDSFMCVPWLPHVCDATHFYAWLESSTRDAHINRQASIFEWRDSFMLATWHASLTKRNRIKIFGSPDLSVSLIDLFWVTRTPCTPVKTCLKFWGLPWKLVWNVQGLKNLFKILAIVTISSQISVRGVCVWFDSSLHDSCILRQASISGWPMG